MGDALHRPERQLPGAGRACLHAGIPAVCAGLLFHDTKDRRSGTGFRQISAPCAVLQHIVFIVIVQTIGKIRIGIISDKIEAFGGHGVVVQISEKSVRRDKIIFFYMFPQNVGLDFGKAACACRDKAPVIQLTVRVNRACRLSLIHI